MTGKEESVGKAVRSYLDKKGFRQDVQPKTVPVEMAAFEVYNEQDASLQNTFTFAEKNESVSVYELAYSKLKKWIEESLEIFKNELFTLLYPVFVHCYLDLIAKVLSKFAFPVNYQGSVYEARQFMDHFKGDHIDVYLEDLQKLIGIVDPIQLKENQLAYTFRNNKSTQFLNFRYNLSLSSYSFDLFMAFMQENGLTMLLKIVNQYLNIKAEFKKVIGALLTSVYAGKPKPLAEEEALGITGMADKSSTVNSQPISWGSLPLDPNFENELTRHLKEELARVQKYPDQMQSIMHQMKKLKSESGVNSNAPSRTRIPLPNPTASVANAEIEKVKEMSRKVALGKTSLPSICFYTFQNTYEGLNCIQFSPDSTLIAGGFADSFVEVWNLKGEKLRALKASTDLARMDLKEAAIDDLKEPIGSDSKKLIGHSGPVYSCKFSTDNRFMLTSSQDGTARLWSLDTFTNLVAYKGHNYSVWDCDYGPLGYYFATASADKTARVWSTEYVNPLRIMAGHLGDVDVVKFHPNSNYLATGSSDRTVRLWDIQSGNCVRLFTGHSGGITSLAFSGDGKYLVSGSQDKRLILWDLGSGKCIKKMSGHEKTIYSAEFSMDSNVIVSGSGDCSVKVWDVSKSNSTSLAGAGSDAKDFLGSFATKQSVVYSTQFTYRNMVMAAGVFGSFPAQS